MQWCLAPHQHAPHQHAPLLLAWTDAGYSVLVPPGGLDLQVFESEVARARAARAEGDLQRASDVLHAALKLWRGPLCEGLVGPGLTAERERLGERRVDVLEDWIDLDLALGRTLEVVNELRLLVAQHPLRERLRVLLMLALYRSGRQAEALAAFHEARRHLLDELGVEPGPQLRRVHEQILAADPQLTTAPVVRRGRLPSPAQLPYGLPDFTGREAELARLDVLCAGGGSARPVVIHALAGMGGVGKTALAVHWALSTYLDRQGHWRDLKAVQLAALTAAERAGDRLGEALSHRGVARGCARLDEYDDADRHLRAALKLFNALGDKAGQAYTHRNLAALLEPQGRDAEALHHAQKALRLYRAVGHRAGEADTLNAVGWFHGRMGDHRQSLVCCEEALALHQMLDDLGGQAQTWESLGFAHHSLGDPGQAAACYDQALRLFRELGDRYNQATTLSRLGDVREATGAGDAALEAWNEALAILTEIGHAAAQQVKARLARHRAERAASPPLW